MKVVAFAYHNMGLAGLEALRRAGYEIACIFSHEDDPDENCWFGSVKAWAEQQKIPVHCPADVNRPEWINRISDIRPDMVFSFYYRHMLKDEILGLPSQGAYNLHGSLLPAYRGRCPVNWVLVNGEVRTGVTLHHMVRKADAGDIVGQRAVDIAPDDTAATLYTKICKEAGVLLDELLPLMKEGKCPRIPQDIGLGSYFGGRRPDDGKIDWQWPAGRIYNLVRAVTEPYPGAFGTFADGSRLVVWWAAPEACEGKAADHSPGTVEVEKNGVFIRAGQGRLHLLDVETKEGRKTGEELIRYFNDREGMILS